MILAASLFHPEVAPKDPSFKVKNPPSTLQLDKQNSSYRSPLILFVITCVKVLLGLQIHFTHATSFGILLQCQTVSLFLFF